MIDRNVEIQKRTEFKKMLLELAASPKVLASEEKRNSFLIRFEDLYLPNNNGESFHHYYSDIFIVLTRVKSDPSLGAIQYLAGNINYIRENYKPKDENNSIASNLRKLDDHISLDIARMDYSDKGDVIISSQDKLKELENKLIHINNDINTVTSNNRENEVATNELKKSIDDLNSKNTKFQEELTDTKKSYLEILGIFSGIVLAFMGGMIFSSSVLENIHRVSIYRLSLVSLIIAALILNSLFICFRSIERITNKESKKSISWIVTNVIIFICIIVITVFWQLGNVEKRNKNINKNNTIQIELPSED